MQAAEKRVERTSGTAAPRRPTGARAPVSGDDDADLVRRVVAGDAEAFRLLVDRHHAKVFRLVQGILADWHHSEDVCQEIFTTVYRKLPGFRCQARFSTWLYRVSVNAAVKARRRWRRYDPRPLEAVLDHEGPADASPEFEELEAFACLLRPLPRKLRLPVILREVNELSYDEIAEVLGCTRGAVEQRLHRAMTRLRCVWRGEREGVSR